MGATILEEPAPGPCQRVLWRANWRLFRLAWTLHKVVDTTSCRRNDGVRLWYYQRCTVRGRTMVLSIILNWQKVSNFSPLSLSPPLSPSTFDIVSISWMPRRMPYLLSLTMYLRCRLPYSCRCGQQSTLNFGSVPTNTMPFVGT